MTKKELNVRIKYCKSSQYFAENYTKSTPRPYFVKIPDYTDDGYRIRPIKEKDGGKCIILDLEIENEEYNYNRAYHHQYLTYGSLDINGCHVQYFLENQHSRDFGILMIKLDGWKEYEFVSHKIRQDSHISIHDHIRPHIIEAIKWHKEVELDKTHSLHEYLKKNLKPKN